MRLYKYLSATKWAIGSLKNFEFYFSKFTELNDPCELTISGCSQDQLNLIRFSFSNPSGANGIFCLSERYDNLHMWAQYAAGHRGIVVEFETDENKDFFKELDKVTYSPRPPIYSINMKVKDVIYTKSLDSEKELEWRAFGKSGPRKIKPSAIKSIIFGYRFPIGCSVEVTPFDDLLSSFSKETVESYIEIDRLFWKNLMPDTVDYYQTQLELGKYNLILSPKFNKPVS